MSDWIRTKVGLQAMENIVRYLPRITVALEEIAKNKEYNEEEDVALGSSIVKSNEEVKGVFMSNGKVVNVDYVKDGKE